MRVLLANTNRMKPAVAPVGLDYLADSLRAAGHELTLLDLCFSEDQDRDMAGALVTEPEIIGVSIRNTDDCYFASGAFFLPGIRRTVLALREQTDAPIVLGGVGFSLMPEAVMQYCGADFGIAGEGEEPFVGLMAALGAGSDFEPVPGLLWWDESGLRRNPAAEAPLERLPVRTRSFIDNRRYFAEGGQAGFETRRGCPMACTYCADPVAKGRRSRLLPPRMVVEELRALVSQGIDHVHCLDSEMNLPLAHAQEVCRAIIDAGLAGRIRWYAYCSVSPFDGETARLFRDAGCAGIDFGADSGSPEILRRLGRHYGPEALVEAARACRAAGIPFMYDLLVGSPGETRDTVRQSLELVRKAGPDCIGLSLGVRVYDGTTLAEQVREMGPLESNPGLRGAKLDNEDLLRPLFYLSPQLGSDPVGFVRDLVGGDQNVFLPGGPDDARDYNYNDNERLVQALARGERGAYWDILRRSGGS
jgi:tryptophan 2-C-methyltransferase